MMLRTFTKTRLPVCRQCCAVCEVEGHRRLSYVNWIVRSFRGTLHAAAGQCRAGRGCGWRWLKERPRCPSKRSLHDSHRPCDHGPWRPGRPRAHCAVTSATRGWRTSVGRETPSRTARSDVRRSRAGCHAATGLGTSLRHANAKTLEITYMDLILHCQNVFIIRPPGTVVHGRPYVLQQFYVTFFHREISEVRRPISAKFCDIVGSMFSLQMPVRKFGVCPPPKKKN